MQNLFNVYKNGHLHLRLSFQLFLVVKVLDSQCRVPGSNLLGGFEDQGYFNFSSRTQLNIYDRIFFRK